MAVRAPADVRFAAERARDARWQADLQSGDRARQERAIAALYEQYWPLVYKKCAQVLNDDAQACDAAQATFIRAWTALQEPRDEPLRLMPWLCQVAIRCAIDERRREQRHRDHSERLEKLLPGCVGGDEHKMASRRLISLFVDPEPGPERHALGREALAEALKVAEQLTPRGRAALLASAWDNRLESVRRALGDPAGRHSYKYPGSVVQYSRTRFLELHRQQERRIAQQYPDYS